MGRLTMDQILRENQCRDTSSLTSLQLSHRALSDVSCLSNFQNLEKLDLSYSCLTSLEGLSACVNLKWLQVLENKLVTLKGIESLSKLMVLNAGRNKLEKMDDICAVTSLRALILNDNDISSICQLDKLIYLNTLVLSRNPIHVIGNSLEKVTSLVKLSISHCKLETIGSSLVACVELKEARFSHNKITALPKELANNIWLRTLDMGSNLIEKLSEIKVLSDLPNLKNLNLLGNPIAANDKMIKKVRRLVPNVSIFNTKPTERSTSYVKSSEIAAFPQQKADSSLQISFGAKDSKKSKKGEPRQDDDAFERNALNNSLEETMADDSLLRSFTDIEVERKVKKIKPGADADISVAKKSKSFSEVITDNAATSMEMKKKKNPASNTDVWKSNSAYLDENIQPKIEHISKRKESYGAEAGALFYEFDDAETPFVDLIVSGKKKTTDDSQRKKGREAHRDTLITDGIVIESNKKAKRRFKKMDPGLLAMFSSEHEVGMGGSSTWDA